MFLSGNYITAFVVGNTNMQQSATCRLYRTVQHSAACRLYWTVQYSAAYKLYWTVLYSTVQLVDCTGLYSQFHINMKVKRSQHNKIYYTD
jgi:hypothetical protein